jgi:Na+/melibiose symporter-like transporter
MNQSWSFSKQDIPVAQAVVTEEGQWEPINLPHTCYDSVLPKQTQAALDGIYRLGTLVPAIVFFVIFIMLVFIYPLNKQRILTLATDLAAKRSEV